MMKRTLFTLAIIVSLSTATAAGAQEGIYESEQHDFRLEVIADNLEFPWAVAFLPDGDFLVTEKPGRLLRVTPEGKKDKVSGLPPITARGQGGLLDVTLHPDFADNRYVYFSYVSRGYGGTGTEVARGRLDGITLRDVETIFQADPKMRSNVHFGARLLFAPDGYLYITLGERYRMDDAQNNANHLGTVIRLHHDGRVPDDNPFAGPGNARPEIYSYGHRNVQGIDRQPGTNQIWIHEHGPKGGDEVNILEKGANYGWPAITYGIDYDGTIITEKTRKPGMKQPVIHWTPSIAPCGMSFYDGDKFPQWQGDIFVGALVKRHLRRLEVNGTEITEQEVLLKDLGARIRDVATGPDGALYLLTDDINGLLIRLVPVE